MEFQNEKIARFALTPNYEKLGSKNIDLLKRHLLDSLGSLLYSATSTTVHKLVQQIQSLGEGGPCRVPLLGRIAFDRAAQLYTAMIRYPDFMDNYLGKEATCHPSDNIGALLAASQLTAGDGKDFLAAMGLAYEIECRLTEEIPVMKEGIDHTLLLTYSIVASVSKLIGLTEKQITHALAIAGSSMSPLVTSRASYTFEWKGFASSLDALNAVQAVLLSKHGMTGPVQLFEGPKGFEDIFGMKLKYDWSQDGFELIEKCILKSYNAEIHTQPAIEAAVDIRRNNKFSIQDIEKVEVTTFLTAYHITGSGTYGDRKDVGTKEQADHSLFYVVAVALLDGMVYPEQLTGERIRERDVQDLLQKVDVQTKVPFHKPVTVAGMLDPYTLAYPGKVMAKVEVVLNDGRKFTVEKEDYAGFHTRPLNWDEVIKKFRRLSQASLVGAQQDKLIALVQQLEHHNLQEVIDVLVADRIRK